MCVCMCMRSVHACVSDACAHLYVGVVSSDHTHPPGMG